MLSSKKIQKIICEYGRKIDAPLSMLPTIIPKSLSDGTYFDTDGCYRLIVAERGKILKQYQYQTIKDFLYRVFFRVTFEMAVLGEVGKRIDTEDSRKMIFKLQRNWMEQVDSDFLPQYDEEIAQLLREYPYKT